MISISVVKPACGPVPRVCLLFLLTGIALTACSQQKQAAPAPTPRAALPSVPPVVDVTLREYAFDLTAHLAAGRVVFRVRNGGQLAHELVLVSVPDDVAGTLDEQVHGSIRRPLTPIAILPRFASGEASSFAVDLSPGRYGFMCFVHDAEDPPETNHALKGMTADFSVR